jgi:hypothetical protein
LEYAGRITVEDASGCRFQIAEFRGRRLLKTTRRFVLENGERVHRIDFDNYVVVRSGECLVRVDAMHPSYGELNRPKGDAAQQGFKAAPPSFAQ